MFRKLYISTCETFIDKNANSQVLALQRMFRNHGFKINENEIRFGMGLPKKQHLRKMFELPNMIEQYKYKYGAPFHYNSIHTFLQDYNTEQTLLFSRYAELTKLSEDAKILIDFFRSHKYPIGLTSTMDRDVLNTILNSFKMQKFVPDFDIASNEELGFHIRKCLDKFKINSNNTLLFGSTSADLHKAKDASIRFVGVENDYFKRDDFILMGADFTVKHLKQISQII